MEQRFRPKLISQTFVSTQMEWKKKNNLNLAIVHSIHAGIRCHRVIKQTRDKNHGNENVTPQSERFPLKMELRRNPRYHTEPKDNFPIKGAICTVLSHTLCTVTHTHAEWKYCKNSQISLRKKRIPACRDRRLPAVRSRHVLHKASCYCLSAEDSIRSHTYINTRT